uniref:Uncharacterized protein n=1 Tax=Setaria italica TaxID=4555 RepID=K4AHT5_SETIT
MISCTSLLCWSIKNCINAELLTLLFFFSPLGSVPSKVCDVYRNEILRRSPRFLFIVSIFEV